MSVVSIYNGVFQSLANDPDIINYLGIDTTLSVDDLALAKAMKIQKREKPQNPTDNMPLIAFYKIDGGFEKGNSEVFIAPFIFDVYTNDDVELAQLISEKIRVMFHNEIPPFAGITTYTSEFIDAAEASTDLANCYKFRTIIVLSVTFDD